MTSVSNLLSGLVGAVLGAGLSAWATIWVARWSLQREHERQAAQYALEHRQMPVGDFVRHLLDLYEVGVNPSANAGRSAAVRSASEGSLAVLQANMMLPAEGPVWLFVGRLLFATRFIMSPSSAWSDFETLKRQGVDPLVRWAASDQSFQPGWFAAHVGASDEEFARTSFDIEPATSRIGAVTPADSSRRRRWK